MDETRYFYRGGAVNPLNLAYGAYPVYTHSAVDRSGSVVGGGLEEEEQARLDAILQVLSRPENAPYLEILNVLQQRILANMGPSVVDQFHKGAHIVFEDGGAVYHDIFRIAAHRGIAKLRKRSWWEYFTGAQIEPVPTNLSSSDSPRGPGVGSRRPEKRQTSHYERDVLPQLGIDLPGGLIGHILVGMVPNRRSQYGDSAGNTFIQTEQYGFKSFYDHRIGHGFGLFWNLAKGWQSGLAGHTKHSEKTGTEIREQDNRHRR
ncbi:hypothetical protein FKG94_17870 [Exilibacterium tricleocarpae]|uniref:Uncharacterized protein n=1 Tax=Exilibacterium tricleocarpae TaxID=2591008 RepID=A0A545T5P6_9GAMM|nr:hypothetical protein [Exilibacterium tricleocarpae]TQV72570.1 hypothetical protein FKG94_17870 [Exilibacterium tricleocarpae]